MMLFSRCHPMNHQYEAVAAVDLLDYFPHHHLQLPILSRLRQRSKTKIDVGKQISFYCYGSWLFVYSFPLSLANVWSFLPPQTEGYPTCSQLRILVVWCDYSRAELWARSENKPMVPIFAGYAHTCAGLGLQLQFSMEFVTPEGALAGTKYWIYGRLRFFWLRWLHTFQKHLKPENFIQSCCGQNYMTSLLVVSFWKCLNWHAWPCLVASILHNFSHGSRLLRSFWIVGQHAFVCVNLASFVSPTRAMSNGDRPQCQQPRQGRSDNSMLRT